MNKGVFNPGICLASLKYTAPAFLVRAMLLFVLLPACQPKANSGENSPVEVDAIEVTSINQVVVGATRFDTYLPLLQGKNVGMIVNHSSLVGDTHLVDTLLSLGIQVKRSLPRSMDSGARRMREKP